MNEPYEVNWRQFANAAGIRRAVREALLFLVHEPADARAIIARRRAADSAYRRGVRDGIAQGRVEAVREFRQGIPRRPGRPLGSKNKPKD